MLCFNIEMITYDILSCDQQIYHRKYVTKMSGDYDKKYTATGKEIHSFQVVLVYPIII